MSLPNLQPLGRLEAVAGCNEVCNGAKALDDKAFAGRDRQLLGGPEAAKEVFWPRVYDELRSVAKRQMRSGAVTLQATALVHEAYFRLLDQNRVRWQDRSHFFGIAAQMMRRILIDHVRRYQYLKRGGDRQRVTLDAAIELTDAERGFLVQVKPSSKGGTKIKVAVARGFAKETLSGAQGKVSRTVVERVLEEHASELTPQQASLARTTLEQWRQQSVSAGS